MKSRHSILIVAALFALGCNDNGTNDPGTGGSGGDGTGGVGGNGETPECRAASDCDDDSNQCTAPACDSGSCGFSNVADGSDCDLNGDADGWCQSGQCEARPECTDADDCGDPQECVLPECVDGTCGTTPVPEGEVCSEGFCDGAGACVECLDVDACEDDGNQCTSAECLDNACATSNVPDETTCDLNATGDGWCQNGECVETPDCFEPADCEVGECLSPLCVDGACSSEPVDAGESCTDGVCDGEGTCVECVDLDQCEDDGNQCTAASCSNNACETNNVPNETACDLNDIGDGLCADGECVECTTTDQCVADECFVPSCEMGGCGQTPAPAGDTCSIGVCDGQGLCVECLDASVCNDDENQCTAPACNDNVCGLENVPNDTMCDLVDLEGWCQDGVCVERPECIDPSECGEGLSECLEPTCTDGMCGSIELEEGTPCTEGVCDGAGSCVECLDDTVCSTDDECLVPSCINNACGTTPADAGVICTDGVCDGTGICVGCLSDDDCGALEFCNPESVCEVLPTPDAIEQTVELACTIGVFGSTLEPNFYRFSLSMRVEPLGPIVAGQNVDARVQSNFVFSQEILNDIIDLGAEDVSYDGRGAEIMVAAGGSATSVLSAIGAAPVDLTEPGPLVVNGTEEVISIDVASDATTIVFDVDGNVADVGDGFGPDVGDQPGESRTGVVAEARVLVAPGVFVKSIFHFPCVPGQWTQGDGRERPLIPAPIEDKITFAVH